MTPFGPIGSVSSGRSGSVLRADLHVHSRYSGPGHLRGAGGRAGVGEPADIYRAAKERGMALVTLTDRDTIEGCLRFMDRHPDVPDFIVSEEVSTRDPRTNRRYHVLVYGLDEVRHGDITRARGDVRELSACLRSIGLTAALGSDPGDSWAGLWSDPEGGSILDLFDRVEVKSGAHGRRQNELAARLLQTGGRGARRAATGGSCAHGPLRVGTTWTAAVADDPAGFVSELRAGRTWAGGADGGVWALSRDLSRSLARGCLEKPGSLLGLPVDLLRLPLRHGWGYARRAASARRTGRRLDREDLSEFQAKARTYLLPARSAGENAGDRS